MEKDLAQLASPGAIGLASLGLIAVSITALLLRSRFRERPTAEQLEHRRREWLSTNGKLGGGEITEVQDAAIAYAYDVRGMSYSASQDISALAEKLPRDRWSIIGAVGVRYDPKNPANSIILSESWSGLRRR